MALTVKICGLKTPEALEVALESGADLTGFVFFPPSPRNLGLEAARALGAQVKGRAGKVALTVDANDETLLGIIDALKPDMLQLHGNETPERVVAVRSRFGLPVMKALPIASAAICRRSALYANVADRLLFDARAPHEATRPGGLGRRSTGLCSRTRSGDAVHAVGRTRCRTTSREALRDHQAPGVDVSSGVERAPGEKDPDKIRAFIRARARAERRLANES